MTKSTLYYFCLCLVLLIVTDCARISSHYPVDKYTIKVLPKKRYTDNPVIFGHTDELYPDGSYHSVILAYILINNQGVKSDEYGNYSLNVIPGKHDVVVRSIGYQPMLLKRLQVDKGDSIRIDFHLAADTVKL